VTGTLTLPWDDRLLRYDFGRGHPFNPVRLELTMALARDLGVLDAPAVTVVPVPRATDDELRTVHTAGYVEAVKAAGDAQVADQPHGLGTPDNPVFPAMHAATADVVGATLTAARALADGTADHAVSIAGGLHHAMPDRAAGFCLYNDLAVAIRELLVSGVDRVAYVDVDVHHGDGVEEVFRDDPRVLTISLHESGRTLFPGTGWPEETGGPAAPGSVVNVALPAGTGDAGWLRAFEAVVPPLLAAFRPTVLVSQHGCDSHALDPLANLLVSVDAQRQVAARLHALAHELCDGRWLATGGGGYEVVRVVPRSWSHLLAVAAGRPVDAETDTPDDWRAAVHARTGATAPLRMTDGRPCAVTAYPEGADPVDAAIRATRAAVFPLHRLAP
jgi:acetoin utilization protein AcuC